MGQLLVVGREGNADGGKPLMHDHRESDDLVIPAKPPNKPGRPGAEVVEGKAPDNRHEKGNERVLH